MKIYTKQGDLGKTRLVGGECVQKNNPRVECYGTIDELNSCIGLAICNIEDTSTKNDLKTIQNQLFNIGSLVSCENEETIKLLPPLELKQIEMLELRIDQMTAELPILKNFILPGGCLASSHLHLARTVCRRSERSLVGIIESSTTRSQLIESCLVYLNRLSDYLFVCARHMNKLNGQEDELWNK